MRTFNLSRFLSSVRDAGLDGYMMVVGLIMVLTVLVMAVFAEFIAPYDPVKTVGMPVTPPSPEFPWGTDTIGRDVFSRVVYGSRTIMVVILMSTALSMVVGIPLGLISGYVGGPLDRVFSLVMDSIYAFPGLILAIAVAAMLGPGIYNTSISLAVVYIPTYFRMVRGQVLSLREQLFVEAARALGATDWRILRKYIFPNVFFIIAVVFSLNVADAILTEAGLSFLGLSVPAPTPDWGFDLKNGQRYFLSGKWWPVVFPGTMIILLALGFGLLGEGLNRMLGQKEVR
ncbi:MAG: ABC transporter permease [Candidatus Korarchaeota archaeon]|nr:ABC transporter permease [Candidatus Korarchaeota archaeon]